VDSAAAIIYVISLFIIEIEMWWMHLFLPIGLRDFCGFFLYVAWEMAKSIMMKHA